MSDDRGQTLLDMKFLDIDSESSRITIARDFCIVLAAWLPPDRDDRSYAHSPSLAPRSSKRALVPLAVEEEV